jgi:hypothetical protein
MSTWVRLLTVALAALAVGVSAASAQSLGEVARKEQQRRKTTAKTSGKTYTNRDLGPGGTRPPAPPAPASQTAGPGGAAATDADKAKAAEPPAAPKDPRETEEYWRERMEGAKAELQRNEMFLEALQSRVNALTTDFVNRDDPAQRAVVATDRQKALVEMERTKELVAKLKQQIADIEEEARQAGVPPGWIR